MTDGKTRQNMIYGADMEMYQAFDVEGLRLERDLEGDGKASCC